MTIAKMLAVLALAGGTAVLGACAADGPEARDAGAERDAVAALAAADGHAAHDAATHGATHGAAHEAADGATAEAAAETRSADPRHVVMWQSPTCGCCGDWAEHMKAAGYTIEVRKRTDVRVVKEQHGLPRWSWSCHTAEVGGKVVEGHVPADLVDRMLAEADPAVRGVVVPGMPAGSPGMGDPPGRPLYDVLTVDADGGLSPWVRR